MSIDNKRIAKNTLMLYLRMLLLMVVSLYTSRVVLATLGIDDFGIYNLVGGFITLFSFVTNALVGAMQRFFNVALGKNDHIEFRRLYSMGMNMFLLLSILIIVIGETIGLWFVENKLNIPAGRESATIWVYHISIVTMIIRLFRTPDNASIIAHEKMAFYAYVSILEAVLKLLIVFMIIKVEYDKLILYVVLYMAATALINVVYFVYSRIRIPDSKYFFFWDKKMFRNLLTYSGWNMLTGGARVTKSQSDNYLLNLYFSVSVNAAFGIASQVYNAVNEFLTNFQTAFRPQLVQSYASGNMNEHYLLLYRSAKFSFFLLWLIEVPVLFNLNEILGIWLEEVPDYTSQLCIYVLFAYLIDSIGAPLCTSISANGNIKGIQIWSTLILLFSIFVNIYFLKLGAGPYIISIVILFVHILFWVVYMYYSRKLCGVNLNIYFRVVVKSVVLVTVASLIVPFILFFKNPTGILAVIFYCALDFLWVLSIIYFIGLTKEEKIIIKTALRNKFIKNRGYVN